MSGGACSEFKANLFKKNTCQTCFKSKDQHSGEDGGARESAGAMAANRTVVKEGYLTKSPPDLNAKFGSKQWKKRWFVVTSDATLTYYESEKTYPKKPLGDINLLDCSKIAEGDTEAKQFNCLALTTPNRVYYIKAESKDDIDAWNTALQGQLPSRKSSVVRRPREPSTSPAAEPITERQGSVSSVGSGDASARPRGSSQIAKLRARSMAPETSRRETLSSSRRRQGGSMLLASNGNDAGDDEDVDDSAAREENADASGPADDASARSTARVDTLSPAGKDWDTLDDVSGDVAPAADDVTASAPTDTLSPAGKDWDTLDDVSGDVAPAVDDVTASSPTDSLDSADAMPGREDEPTTMTTTTTTTTSAEVSSVAATSRTSASEPARPSDARHAGSGDSARPASSADVTPATPDLAEYAEQLASRDATIRALQTQLDQWQGSQATLEGQVSGLRQELSTAKSDIQSGEQQAVTQRQADAEQMLALQLVCDELRTEKSGLEEKISGLSADNEALSASNAELNCRLENAGNATESETARLSAEKTALQAKMTELTKRLEELDTENSELGTRLECAAEASQSERSRLTGAHEAEAKSLKDKVGDLESRVVELQQTSAALTATVESGAAHANAAGSKMEEMRKEHKKAVDELQEKVAALEEQVGAATGDEARRGERRRADSVRLQAAHDGLRRDIAARDEQLQDAEARLTTAQRERDDRGHALAAAQAQLAEERQSKRRMLDKLAEEGESESAAAVEEMEREKARMKMENRRSAFEYGAQISELHERVADADELRAERRRQDAVVAEQRAQLAAARSDALRASAEGEERSATLQARLELLERELGETRQRLKQSAADAASGSADLQRTLEARAAELKALEMALERSAAACGRHEAAARDAELRLCDASEQHRDESATLQQQLATAQATQAAGVDALDGVPKETAADRSDAVVGDLRQKTDELERRLVAEKSKMQSRQDELSDEVKELRATAAEMEASRSKLERDKFDLEEAVRAQREEVDTLREELKQSEAAAPIPAPETPAELNSIDTAPSLFVAGKGKSTVTNGRPSDFTSQSGAFTFASKSNVAAAKSTNFATAAEVNAAHLSTQKQLDDLQRRNHRLAQQEERQRRLEEVRTPPTSPAAATPSAKLPSASRERPLQEQRPLGSSRSASSAPVSPAAATISGSPFASWTASPGKTKSFSTATRVESQANAEPEAAPPAKPRKPVLTRGPRTQRTAATGLSAVHR